ncbi:MAG: hypothetical protein FJX53_10265 [Alphaproteobacteria bacterium]|nr:hypothetical protein [Alphaproteobacteria bacterium]
MLALYGSFNITGDVGTGDVDFRSYSEIANDAMRILSAVRQAQIHLRAASGFDTINASAKTRSTEIDALKLDDRTHPTVMDARRVETVLQLALDAERPTLRRASRSVLDFVIGVSTGNVDRLR